MEGESGGEPITIHKRRKAVTDVQAGGEYIFRRKYPLRAGCFTSFSSAPGVDPEDEAAPSRIDLYGVTASVGMVGENVVVNVGLSYVWGEGDARGVRFDDQEFLSDARTRTREQAIYAFASTAYRF